MASSRLSPAPLKRPRPVRRGPPTMVFFRLARIDQKQGVDADGACPIQKKGFAASADGACLVFPPFALLISTHRFGMARPSLPLCRRGGGARTAFSRFLSYFMHRLCPQAMSASPCCVTQQVSLAPSSGSPGLGFFNERSVVVCRIESARDAQRDMA